MLKGGVWRRQMYSIGHSRWSDDARQNQPHDIPIEADQRLEHCGGALLREVEKKGWIFVEKQGKKQRHIHRPNSNKRTAKSSGVLLWR